jgi:hypothetical protein
MSTSAITDRRIHLRAYAYGKICTVNIRGVQHQVDLVDISPGGSRLRFSADTLPDMSENEVLSLSCTDPSLEGLLNALSAEVRWRSAREIGVRFLDELPMTTPDIQRLIGPSDA